MKLPLLALFAALSVPAGAQMGSPPIEVTDPGPTGRRVTDDGLIANFFPAAAPGKHGAILIVGGSEGGLGSGTKRMALSLQAAGFNVLHLTFFRAPGQSDALQRVPLERFASGIGWLQRQPSVDPRRIALIGGSKGAEAVLLVASRTPAIRAVVAGMPSSVVWPAFSWTSGPVAGSSWTQGGKDVPTLPYGNYTAPNLLSVYASGLAKLPNHPEAAIPIEKSRAEILLVCGDADTLWPSCPMAEQLQARDTRHVTVLDYKDAGHGVFGVPVDPAGRSYASIASLGGTVAGTAHARIDGWPKVLAFLHKTLGR
ncbi:Acyl-CoA thioester hydrolase [Sphingomonas antarctica]|uniref:acyl-CoA thioester hydrolase/BAAT C-terminal domain-containing protein n=1 Tax=Sphingomonas antarctica TaxID=2040274 RepID=UPI0039E75AB9